MSDLDRRHLELLANRATGWAVFWVCISAGAALISLTTYSTAVSSPGGGYYFVWWGPVVFGVWYAIKSTVKSARIRALLRQVSPTAQPPEPNSRVTANLDATAVAHPDLDPQVVVRTSAEYASSSWSAAKRSDLTRGWLLLIATPRGLRLKFKADAGSGWALYASKIHEVALVGNGPNVIVEVIFKHPGEPLGIRTLVGPRGRMQEICRLIGHSIH